MKKRLLVVLLSLLMVLSAMPLPVLAQESGLEDYGIPGTDYVEGEAIVCVKGGISGLSGGTRNRSVGSAYSTESLMVLDSSESTERVEAAMLRTAEPQTDDELILVKADDGSSTGELIEALTENPAVRFAEPNYILKASAVENDAYEDMSAQQWGLANQRQNQADINVAPLYQDGKTGSEEVVVAVVDTGIDATHPDLAGQMWDRGLEYPELAAMGGGVYGINTHNTYEDSRDTSDDYGHGTHCAGIIGASWDGQGIQGVSEKLRIMAIKTMDYTGDGNTGVAIRAFAYLSKACDLGVNIRAANNSWSEPYSNALKVAVDELGRKGVVSVFASGNSSQDVDENPNSGIASSQSPYAISVNSMDEYGGLDYFSNYGVSSTDIYAPGTRILSTIPQDRAEYNGLLTQDNLIYTGFETQSTATDRLDVPDSEGRALTFYTYDETKKEENFMGKPLSTGGQDRAVYGSSALDINPERKESTRIISAPITLNGAKENLNLSFTADGPERSLANVFIRTLADGQVYHPKAYNSSSYYDEESGGVYISGCDWLNNYAELEDEWVKGPFQIIIMLEQKPDADRATYIDTVGIGSQKVPYSTMGGTSMAAPAVTGTVALLTAAYPDEDAAKISARIIGGANRSMNTDMNSRCLSGGSLDAEKAWKNPDPAPKYFTESDGSLAIDGYFFGSTVGQAEIGGVPVSVTDWSDTRVTVTMPEGFKADGMTEVRVTRADGSWGRGYYHFDAYPEQGAFKALALPAESPDYAGSMLERIGTIGGYMAAAGQKIYYLGSDEYQEARFVGVSDYVSELWCYDISGNHWQRLGDLPDVPYRLSSLCAWEGKIYALGTYKLDETNAEQRVYTYDPKSGKWNGGQRVDTAYPWSGSLINYQDKLVIAGGVNLQDSSQTVEISALDPETGILSPLKGIELPEKMSMVTIAVGGEKREQLILNGYTQSNSDDYIDEVSKTWLYDGQTWKEIPMPEKTVPEGTVALGGTRNGALLTGYRDASDDGQDTVVIDAAEASFIEDAFYPTGACDYFIGHAYSGNYYVLASASDTRGLAFKRMAVDTVDPKEATDPEPAPSVNPDPTAPPADSGQSSGSNAGTGITGQQTALAAATMLAVLALAILAYRQKKR